MLHFWAGMGEPPTWNQTTSPQVDRLRAAPFTSHSVPILPNPSPGLIACRVPPDAQFSPLVLVEEDGHPFRFHVQNVDTRSRYGIHEPLLLFGRSSLGRLHADDGHGNNSFPT